MSTDAFLVVTYDARGERLYIEATDLTHEGAIEKARQWATTNPGKTCFVMQRLRLVASDALREVVG